MEISKTFKEIKDIKENRIFKKTSQALLEIGIKDYSYEPAEGNNGILFIIRLPGEHVQNVKKQLSGVLGFIESTEFQRDKLIPLVNKIRAIRDLNCETLQGENENEVVIRVFKDKWKNASRIIK
jgi:hypothetical protein